MENKLLCLIPIIFPAYCGEVFYKSLSFSPQCIRVIYESNNKKDFPSLISFFMIFLNRLLIIADIISIDSIKKNIHCLMQFLELFSMRSKNINACIRSRRYSRSSDSNFRIKPVKHKKPDADNNMPPRLLTDKRLR